MKDLCLICSRPVDDYDPGTTDPTEPPQHPCVCSNKCFRAVMDYVGEDFEERRRLAGIKLYIPKKAERTHVFYFGPYTVDTSIEDKFLRAGKKCKRNVIARRSSDPIRVKDIKAKCVLETHRVDEKGEYTITVGGYYRDREVVAPEG